MITNRPNEWFLISCLIMFTMVFLMVPASAINTGTLSNHSQLSGSTLLKGEPLTISGNMPGMPELRIWIFGPQYVNVTTLPVQSNGAFRYTLSSKEIEVMKIGNYTVVLQAFGDNSKYDVSEDKQTEEVINENMAYSNPDRVLYTLAQAKDMLDTDAPDALVRALNNSSVEDTYAIYRFSIADPFIELDPIRDYYVGETVTISGRTNIPAGERLDIEFARTFKDYGEPGDIVRQWRYVTIETGSPAMNYFSANFNSSATKPGEHVVVVQSSLNRSSLYEYSTFNLLEAAPSTVFPTTTVKAETPDSKSGTVPPVTTTSTALPVPVIIPVVALVAVVLGGHVWRRD